jgi:hypothetical protein
MLWRSSRGRPSNAPAAFIHPCQPTVAKQPPTGAGWAHELKHDTAWQGIAMKLKLLLASATLAAGTTVLNAADEKAFEKALLGNIMWSAFQCSTYAQMSDTLVDKSEQERLHLVGLNAGRTFLEAMKAGQIPEQALRKAVPINVLQRLEGPSNEVIIDKIYAAATGQARDYIVKRKTGIWGPTEKQEAKHYYVDSNCILIR